jgi:IMP dehydrogenase
MEEYLTFDDVLLLPQESSVLPSQIDTTSRLVLLYFYLIFFTSA